MAGPHPRAYGGMPRISRTYLDYWDEDVCTIHYVSLYDNSVHPVGHLRRFLTGLWQYLIALVMYRPHVIHIHFSKGGSLIRTGICLLLGRLFRYPVLMHQNSSNFMPFYRRQPGWIQACIRYLLRQAQALVVVAECYRAEMHSLSLDVPCWILPNPLPPHAETDTLTGIADTDVPACLFLARLRRDKGLYDLLEAIPQVLNAVPHAQIIIAGDGDHPPVSSPQVRFVGWVDGKEKQKWLQRSQILVHPTHNDAMPLAVMEAMQHRLGIIASDVGGIGEMITHEQHGLLIEPHAPDALAEAMIRLLTDIPLREKLGGQAQQQARHWETDRVLPQLYAFYRQLTPATPAARATESPEKD